MILGQEKPTLEDVLAHHGVKGMKWGVRRRQIKSARSEIRGQKHQIKDVKARLKDGHDPKLEGQLSKLQADLKNNPNRSVAVRMTVGEKTAALLMAGPVGLVPITATSLVSRSRAKSQKG